MNQINDYYNYYTNHSVFIHLSKDIENILFFVLLEKSKHLLIQMLAVVKYINLS